MVENKFYFGNFQQSTTDEITSCIDFSQSVAGQKINVIKNQHKSEEENQLMTTYQSEVFF